MFVSPGMADGEPPLTRAPLTWAERTQKRVFDVVIAAGALTLLAPAFGRGSSRDLARERAAAVLPPATLRFQSTGIPHQKFRTMNTLKTATWCGRRRATTAASTRVGRILRKLEPRRVAATDHVLKGDMSLVGPRPHALSHNREYERQDRALVRAATTGGPGITRLEQVQPGFRGEPIPTKDARTSRPRSLLHRHCPRWVRFNADLLRTVFSRGCKGASVGTHSRVLHKTSSGLK